MTIAERIRKARKEAGLTQKQLGDRMGVSDASITQYESGKRNPKVETLQRIAKALGVGVDVLLRDEISVEITDSPVKQALKKRAEGEDATPEDRMAYEKHLTKEEMGVTAISEALKALSSLFEGMPLDARKAVVERILNDREKSDEPGGDPP